MSAEAKAEPSTCPGIPGILNPVSFSRGGDESVPTPGAETCPRRTSSPIHRTCLHPPVRHISRLSVRQAHLHSPLLTGSPGGVAGPLPCLLGSRIETRIGLSPVRSHSDWHRAFSVRRLLRV